MGSFVFSTLHGSVPSSIETRIGSISLYEVCKWVLVTLFLPGLMEPLKISTNIVYGQITYWFFNYHFVLTNSLWHNPLGSYLTIPGLHIPRYIWFPHTTSSSVLVGVAIVEPGQLTPRRAWYMRESQLLDICFTSSSTAEAILIMPKLMMH